MQMKMVYTKALITGFFVNPFSILIIFFSSNKLIIKIKIAPISSIIKSIFNSPNPNMPVPLWKTLVIINKKSLSELALNKVIPITTSKNVVIIWNKDKIFLLILEDIQTVNGLIKKDIIIIT